MYGRAGLRRARPRRDKILRSENPDQTARHLLAEERRELAAGDRLEAGDAHQHQRFRLRQRSCALCLACGGANGVGEGLFGPVLPAVGDRDQFVGPAGESARMSPMISSMLQLLPTIRANVSRVTERAGGKDDCLDLAHPFAPALLRRQILELAVDQPELFVCFRRVEASGIAAAHKVGRRDAPDSSRTASNVAAAQTTGAPRTVTGFWWSERARHPVVTE